jgi:hypothetical protein
MPEATPNHTTVPTRRRFLSQATGVAASGAVLALATPLASTAVASASSASSIKSMRRLPMTKVKAIGHSRIGAKHTSAISPLFEPQMMLWCERFRVERVIERY